MGKSSNGPDWTDIGRSMMGLEEAHNCASWLIVSYAGTAESSRLSVTVGAWSAAQARVTGTPYVAVGGVWPHTGWKTFEGMVYGLLIQLDHEIAKGWYQQEEMPF